MVKTFSADVSGGGIDALEGNSAFTMLGVSESFDALSVDD